MLIKRIVPALVLVAIMLSGCAPAHTSGAKGRVVDTSTLSFRPIPIDARDTCATQKDVAAHNSVYDTLKKGKEVAYCAPCECSKRYKRSTPKKRKKAPPSKRGALTS